ncbi:MAG TPA: alpha/beta fold hydrolase [Candidatus Andersenbacteria bacterium]|nr:alpha/beta fold hydrolase [Candidatus Andersenbacteria bacterium]
MKQHVLVVHGGTSFDTYQQYLDFIKTRELTVETLTQCIDWRFSLPHELGNAFQVLVPNMPNGGNAKYIEWSIWFTRCISLLKGNPIIIGHSLGGIFLVKYLSEHRIQKKLRAVILIAAPFDHTSTVESLHDFALPESLELFEEQAGEIFCFHSKDDPIVPLEENEKYQRKFPNAHIMLYRDRGHFRQETFPELVQLIRSLVI